jgi:hypothetical protein
VPRLSGKIPRRLPVYQQEIIKHLRIYDSYM